MALPREKNILVHSCTELREEVIAEHKIIIKKLVSKHYLVDSA